MKILMILGIVLVVIALIFCCVFSCLRELCLKASIRLGNIVRPINYPNVENLLFVIQTTEFDTFGPLPEGGCGRHWDEL